MKKIPALFAAALLLGACSATGGETVEAGKGDGGAATTTASQARPSTPDDEADAAADDDDGGEAPSTTESEDAGEDRGPGNVEVTDIGFSTYKSYDDSLVASAAAVLAYDRAEVLAAFEVVFTFRDASDKVVGSDTAYVPAIDAGGNVFAEVTDVPLQGEATKVSAEAIVDPDSADFYQGTVLEVTVTGVAQDEYSGSVVSGTALNPGDEVIKSGQIACVLIKADKIVGGASAYLDTLTPGGEVAWETYGTYDGFTADRARCSGGAYG